MTVGLFALLLVLANEATGCYDKLPCDLAASGAKTNAPALPAYSTREMRDWFNREQKQVRVIALLSPTCRMCQKGQGVTGSIFRRFGNDQKLRGFAVWLPMLRSDNEGAAREQARLFTDPRLAQRWDRSKASGELFAKTLNLERTAWDVYLVYGPGVKWTGDKPPAPSFWMHQLREDSGADQRYCLNPAVLTAKVAEHLGASH